jgi:hypothetical protein
MRRKPVNDEVDRAAGATARTGAADARRTRIAAS